MPGQIGFMPTVTERYALISGASTLICRASASIFGVPRFTEPVASQIAGMQQVTGAPAPLKSLQEGEGQDAIET